MGRKDGAFMNLLSGVKQAKPEEMSDLILAVQSRYNELFPDWELSFYTLERKMDRNEQLDAMIALLKNLKEK